MQVTKKQFKSLLKECIKELLEEGSFNAALKEVISESTQGRSNVSAFDILRSSQNMVQEQFETEDEVPQYLNEIYEKPQIRYEQSHLSKKLMQNSGRPQQQQQLPNELASLVRATAHQQAGMTNMKQAGLMEAIFADTAQTTFVNQKEGPGGEVPFTQQQMIQEKKKLESLAPEGDITRWAKVAALSSQSKKI